ncbi:MAG: PucR family transcriptional regulator, partial [Anaerolineales bacterium]
DPAALPEGWLDRRATARKARGQVELQDISDGIARLVTPIVVDKLARGYLSVIGPRDDLDTLDAIAIEQGADIYAVVMSKAKAVSETTKRLRGEFVDAVLSGSISPAELERWAGRLGHNIYAPHAVVSFAWSRGHDEPSSRRLETIVNGEIGLGRHSALVRNAGDQMECFIVLDSPDSIQNAMNLANAVVEQAAREYPDTPVLSGIGRVARRLEDWDVSHTEALQALATARRINEARPLYFGDLSVYRLLFQIEHHPELAQFCDEMLGKLLAYDAQHNSTLIETLTEYFTRRGNLSQTAAALYIHRNTLQYRMERIAEITGLNLDNPETRLAMQLALKAFKLLPAADGFTTRSA